MGLIRRWLQLPGWILLLVLAGLCWLLRGCDYGRIGGMKDKDGRVITPHKEQWWKCLKCRFEGHNHMPNDPPLKCPTCGGTAFQKLRGV